MPKVLIADDKEENRFVLRNFFRLFGLNSGIEVMDAASGAEALQIIDREHPDLVLMDIKMETDTAGLDVTRTIKANPSTAKTVVWALTSQAMEAYDREESDHDKCLKAGCNDYITKPFDQVKMIRQVSQLLNIPIPEKTRHKMGIS